MRRYLFHLITGLFLGMLLSAGIPEVGFATEELPAAEFSLTVLGATDTEMFCTQYDPGSTGFEGCAQGFNYSQHLVALDKKTGRIWMQTVETFDEPIPPNSLGKSSRRVATGQVKSCYLGKIGPEFVPPGYDVNESGSVICPPPSNVEIDEPLQEELPVEVISTSGLRTFCTVFRDTARHCLTGFPFPQNTVFVDKRNGNIWMMTVEADESHLRATGKIKTCIVGTSRPEFSIRSYVISSGSVRCPS